MSAQWTDWVILWFKVKRSHTGWCSNDWFTITTSYSFHLFISALFFHIDSISSSFAISFLDYTAREKKVHREREIIGKGYEYDSIVFDFVENWYEFRYEETEDGPDLIAFTDGTGNDSIEDDWTDSYRLRPNPLDGKLQTLYIKISCLIDDYVEWRVDSQEYRLI